MNRRGFLKTLGLFSILPGAGRRWIKTSENLLVPEWMPEIYPYQILLLNMKLYGQMELFPLKNYHDQKNHQVRCQ